VEDALEPFEEDGDRAHLLLPDPYGPRAPAHPLPAVEDWSDVPFLARPAAGGLPERRLRRKREQLDSLAAEVVSVTRGQCHFFFFPRFPLFPVPHQS